jgi:AraC family transcriptional regulator of adaptative response / methylphosphotriester-DNA alkyltransferase methyltransferase
MARAGHRLSVGFLHAGAGNVLEVQGDVDLGTAPALIAAFTRASAPGTALAVDLTMAGAADGDGMALLLGTVRRLERARGGLVVVCPPGPVRDALERTGLAQRVTLLDDAGALTGPDSGAERAGSTERIDGHRQRLTTPARRATLLAEATVVIERRYPEAALALPDVAREIATSSRQLQRVFAELAGTAFRDELAAVRMQHGAALLLTTDLPVSEIAQRVGYRQAAQFAKAFRRHHGTSPSGLRRAPG